MADFRSTARVPLRTTRVLKFGGSSLATPDRIRDVARIVLDAATRGPIVVVVSAFHDVTNQLLDCAHLAARGDGGHARLYGSIGARHRAACEALLDPENAAARRLVDDALRELDETLARIARDGCGPAELDASASVGERLSALIVSAYLQRFRPARFVDARGLVTTDDQFTRANVIFGKTNRAIREHFDRLSRRSPRWLAVVTGFIGRAEDGRTTTIGRNGSDYTAAIVGAALDASAIEIWTDVDGVMSADPKVVGSARVLPQITYEEARELSQFGARVLHAPAIGPAVERAIPILVKNTLNPAAPGTVIGRAASPVAAPPIGISSIDDVTILTLGARGTAAVPAVAERVFGALTRRGVAVVFGMPIAGDQAVSVAVHRADAGAAAEAIGRAFDAEIVSGSAVLEEKADQAIVAVVGDGLARRPGCAAEVLSSLARNDIGVAAIAQGAHGAHGASSRSLVCIVESAARARAMAVIHEGLFETRTRLALVVIGVGRVGGALLRELHDRRTALAARGVDVRVIAVADSRRFVVSRDGIDLARWRETLLASTGRTDPRTIASEVAALRLEHAALVDCTAAEAIVDAYPDFVEAGLHVVTPNKRANVQPWTQYAALRRLLAERRRHFYDSTNVGAGLPILSTLRHVTSAGGTVSRIEGIVSGTLNHLFTAFDGRVPFSALVRDAHRLALTEPDPRDDLSGQDVARKLLILAREMGSAIELEDVAVESLVPASLRGRPFSDEFFTAYASHDAEMEARLQQASRRNGVLRYIATVERGRAEAGLRELPADHPLAAARGSDNVVAITSDRCERTPIVVRGAGAGADVTARSLMGDVCALAQRLRV